LYHIRNNPNYVIIIIVSHNSSTGKQISKNIYYGTPNKFKKDYSRKKHASKAMSPPKSVFAKGRYTGSPGLGKKG
jgi:hypothetical protein